MITTPLVTHLPPRVETPDYFTKPPSTIGTAQTSRKPPSDPFNGSRLYSAWGLNPKRPMLLIILLVGLLIRLAFALTLDPSAPYTLESSDTRFYLIHGDALVTGEAIPGVELSVLAQPPVYFIVTGIPPLFLSPEGTVIAVRVFQAILSVATAYCAYRITRRIGNERAGIIAAGLVALNPIFIIESAQIVTETVYVFWLAAAFVVYVEAISPNANTPSPLSPLSHVNGERGLGLPFSPLAWEKGAGVEGWRPFALAGALFGLATLTRAVLLAFPIGLVIHLLIVYRGRGWGKIAALLIAYALIVSTWTVYNLARWNRFVIAGEGLPAFLYIGTAGWDDPQAVDQGLNAELGRPASDDPDERQGDYVEAASSSISADPLGYLRRRAAELAGAYLQPHGTTYFGGESLRDLVSLWAREDRTLAGIGRVISGDQFAPKLLLYLFHYTVLILGVIGVWRTRRRWHWTLPLIGFIAYVTLAHFFLLALPRYIFPTMLCWIALASSQFTVNSSQLKQNGEPDSLTVNREL